jgi:hypothetical protein
MSHRAAAGSMDGLQRSRLRALRPALRLALVLVLILPAGRGFAQQGGLGAGGQFPVTPPHGFPQPGSSPFDSGDGGNSVAAEKRLHAINTERQKSLVADTDKLLALATELSNEIAKSNTGELSPAQLHKVEEMEKLAHSVKDKMVMSVRSPIMNMDSPPFLPSLH